MGVLVLKTCDGQFGATRPHGVLGGGHGPGSWLTFLGGQRWGGGRKLAMMDGEHGTEHLDLPAVSMGGDGHIEQ